MASERASHHAFFGVSAMLFAASAALTTLWCASMSAIGEMPMPGDWTMSMVWMRMPRTDVPRRRGIVPWQVGRDDGGDDAAVTGPHAVALPRLGIGAYPLINM